MDIEQLKVRWEVVVKVSGMGDVHDPEVRPFVIIRGTRWERLTTFDDEWQCKKAHGKSGIREIDGKKYGLRNTRFSAFMCNGTTRKFYNNKTTAKHEAEIDAIIEHWTEFNVPVQVSIIEEITKCNICEMKKLPGYKMRGYGQNHSICTLCMVEAAADWIGKLREKL